MRAGVRATCANSVGSVKNLSVLAMRWDVQVRKSIAGSRIPQARYNGGITVSCATSKVIRFEFASQDESRQTAIESWK